MEESQEVVKPTEAVTEVVTDPNEQAQEPVESVIPIADSKDYKAIAEQLSRDIKEKNRKIQELKSTQTVASAYEAPAEDETVQRFIETESRSKRAEANTEIIMKLQADPTFKDRVDIVRDYVTQGYDINMADRLAKADIMDKILTAPQEETPIVKPKQLTPTATPEHQEPAPTGNGFKDMLNDPNMPEAAKEAIRNAFGGMM